MAFNKQITSPFAPLRSNISLLTSHKSLNHIQNYSKIQCDYQSTFPHSSRQMITRQINFIVHQKIIDRQDRKNRINELLLQLSNTFKQRFRQERFSDYKQILKIRFKKDEVYFLVVSEELLQKCSQLVENQRKMANNNAHIWTLCLFQNQNKFKELKRIYNSNRQKQNSQSYYFHRGDQQLNKEIFEIVKKQSSQTAGSNLRIVRRWASTRKVEREGFKKVNFYCESIIHNMLLNYKVKSRNNDINIVEFKRFEDLLLILKKNKLSSLNQTSRLSKAQGSLLQNPTSKITISQKNITSNSYFPKAQTSKIQESIETEMNLCIQEVSSNIIICRKYNDEIKKFRAFVNTEGKNWHLWEITDSAPDIFSNLRAFFGQYKEQSEINDYKLYQQKQCKTQRPEKTKEQNLHNNNHMMLQINTNQTKLTPTQDLKSNYSVSTLQIEEQMSMKNNLSKLILQQSNIKLQRQQYEAIAEPIQIIIKKQHNIIYKISQFNSEPIKNLEKIKIFSNFKEKAIPKRQTVFVQFQSEVIESEIPSLSNYYQLLPDKPITNSIGIDLLNKIKQKVLSYDYLHFNSDKQKPDFTGIKIKNDQFCSFFPLQLPKKPKVIYKLAVLYPKQEKFNNIAKVLKENLEPQQCFVTLIPFSNNLQLQNFYQSKDQKMSKYEKILLLLQNPQQIFETYLKFIKQKLSNRLEYFILTDKFNSINRQKLINHLPNYQMKNYNTPFQAAILPKHFYSCKQYIILVNSQKLQKFKVLQNLFTKVVQYKNFESYKWLRRANSFVIIVVNEQEYHSAKTALKYSQTCAIVAQNNKQLKQDEFYLYKIQQYCLYYGQTALEYLQKILPENPPQNKYISKYLYFKESEYQYTLDPKYEQYDKIEYSSWEEIYRYVVISFRGLNNFLLRVFNQAYTIVTLQPVVYMERPLYIKQFKYFSQQSHNQSLSFWDLPEIYYQNQLSLTSKLQAQQTPGIVLYSKNNEKWMSNLKLKHNDKFKWFCLQDQSWIDQEGNMNSGTDLIKLSTKIKMFSQMFDYRTFKGCIQLTYMFVTYTNRYEEIYMKTIKCTQRDLIVKNQQEVLQLYQQIKDKVFVVFIQQAQNKPKLLIQKSQEYGSRIKLIFVQNKFIEDSSKLYVKYTEINPVIKHIEKLQKLGKRSFIIYHTTQGKIKAEFFITQKGLGNSEQKTYRNIRPELQTIAAEIKGNYRKIFIICFQDEKRDIERLLSSYSIVNANQEHALEFVLMKRMSSPKNFKKQKKLQLNFSEITEQQYSCLCDGRDEYELAIESGPHSCIRHQNEKKKEDDENYRGNLPIQSSDHLDGRKVKMLNIEDFSKIYIVYQQNLELENKKQLLVACSKNQKLRPVLYNSISELKLMKEQANCLMLFFMKQIPMQLFTELVEKQKQQIVFNQTNLKAVLPKNTDINLTSITTHFQLANNSTVKRLKVQQVNQYLKNYEQQSKKVTPKLSVIQQQYGLQPIFDNAKSKLSSVVNPTQQQFIKLKKSLNGSLLVLLVDFDKRNKYTTLAVKYKCLIQSYSDESSLQTQIKTRIRHSIICLADKNLLHKLQFYKQKYSNVFFLLQMKKIQESSQIKEKSFLAGQFSKEAQLQKIIAELAKENQKLAQSNPQNAIEYNSDISGKQKKQERHSSHYQSMMSRAELKKFKQASVYAKNVIVSPETIKKTTLSSSKSKLKVMQKAVKSIKNNEYYQT